MPLLKEITSESLSDFNSCAESLANSSSDDSEVSVLSENNGFKTMNEKKRFKKAQKRLRGTPDKEQFLKKANYQKSPQ